MIFQQQFDQFINDFSVLKKPMQFEIVKTIDDLQAQPAQLDLFMEQITQLIIMPNSQLSQEVQSSNTHFFGIMQIISQHIKQSVCGKHLNNEQAVVCYSCSKDYSNIICFDCFDEEAHKGHDYMIMFGQGQCDCGSNVISVNGYCKKHRGYRPENNIFKEYENEINFDNIIAIFFFLIQDIVCCLNALYINPADQSIQLRISYIIEIVISLMKYPNEAFNQILTNILIFNDVQQELYTTETFRFQSSSKYLLPYCDFDALLDDFKQQKRLHLMQNYPVIMLFMLLPQIIPTNQYIQRFQLYLIQELISFYPYKLFINYIYSNKIKSILDSALSRHFLYINSHNILDQSDNIQKFDFVNNKMFSAVTNDKWFSVPFQSYFIIIQDNIAHFISTLQENSTFSTIQTRMSQGRYTLQNEINHIMIEEILFKELQQFYIKLGQHAASFPYIKCDADMNRLRGAKQSLYKWVTQLMNSAKQPTFYELYSQDNPAQINALITQIQQNIFKLTTINLITKQLHFILQTFSNVVTAFSVILNANKCSNLYITKQIHVTHIQNEDIYYNTITQYCSGPRIYYCKLLQSFFSLFFVKETNEVEYDHPVNLSTSNHKLTKLNENTNINIISLMQILVYFIMQHLYFEENQYQLDIALADTPNQISFNFGTLNEQLSGNITYKLYYYPILNDNLNWLATLINLQYLLIKDQHEISPIYIQVIQDFNPTKYSLPQCLAFISAECVKLLLTQSMLNLNYFTHLGEHIQYIGDIILGKGTKKIHYVSYYYYQLFQANMYTIQSQNIQNLSINDIIVQVFELYGFIDHQTLQFVQYYKKSNQPNLDSAIVNSQYEYESINKSQDIQNEMQEGKILKLLSDALNILFIASMKQLVITSPHEIFLLYAMQSFVQFPNAKQSDVHNMCLLLENYNHNYFFQIHKQYTDPIENNQNNFENVQIYNTGGYSKHYKLKSNALEVLDETNPFFISLNNLIEVIYDLIKDDHAQLIDRINNLLNYQVYIDIYTQDSVFISALEHFLDVYFNINDDYSTVSKENIAQQDILYCLIMTHNVIKYNEKNKDKFISVIQNIYNQHISGKASFMICQYNILVLEQIYKMLNIPQIIQQPELNKPEQSLLKQKINKIKNKQIQNHQLLSLDNEITISNLGDYIKNIDTKISTFILTSVNNLIVCPICQFFQSDKMIGNLSIITPSSLLYNFKNIIPPCQDGKQNVLLNHSYSNLLDHTFSMRKLSYYNFSNRDNNILYALQPIKDRLQLSDMNYNIEMNFVSAQIRTCHHFMDMSCFQNVEEHMIREKVLQCPICRQVYNVLLPIVESLNSDQMIKGILKIGSTLRLIQVLKKFDVYKQQYFTYDYLTEMFAYFQNEGDEFIMSQDNIALLLQRVDYAELSKDEVIDIYKNDLIVLILSLIDVGLQNLILTKQQITNDAQNYLEESMKRQLMNNAITCSAQLIFCAKYLFLYSCKLSIIDFDVEKRRFLNTISLSEDTLFTQKEDNIKRLLLFRYNVLFSNNFEAYIPNNIESELLHDEIASQKFMISKTLFLCNFMFLQEQAELIQEIYQTITTLQQKYTFDNQIEDALEEFDGLETIQIKYQLFMVEQIKQLHSFEQLLSFSQKYSIKQNVLKMFGSKVQLPLFQLTRNLFHFNNIFKNNNLDMIQLYQNYSCSVCRVPRCICLLCNTEMPCVQCSGAHDQAFIHHNHQCNLIGAYYCPLKNIIFICSSTNLVYTQSGPYLSQTGEDDYGYTKNISVYLNERLMQLLQVMLNYENSYLLDYTNTAKIKTFRQFIQFDLYKQADIPVI